jgi:hypothetical protein
MAEMSREEILRKAGELEKQAWELSERHFVMSRELEILYAAKQLLEHKCTSSPFLNPEIMNREFLEQKIREYTAELDRLGHRVHRLLSERDRLISLLGRRGRG